MLEEKVAKYEHVDHPAHYGGKESPYEAIKVISSWLGPRGVFDFDLGNALKYICRAGAKPSESGVQGLKQDLQKAVWYLNHAIEVLSFQACLVRKDDGFDSDSSAAQEWAETPSSGMLSSFSRRFLAGTVLDKLLDVLKSRPEEFICLLGDAASDYHFKKSDKEMSELLSRLRAACYFYFSELATDMRAKEEGVSGEAGRAEEGGSNGKDSDGLAQDGHHIHYTAVPSR